MQTREPERAAVTDMNGRPRLPEAWLHELLGLFPPADGLSPDGGTDSQGAFVRYLSLVPGVSWERAARETFEFIPAGSVPEPYKHLLVHEHHMTVALEARYETSLHLEALAVRQRVDDYARKLILRSGKDGPVVMAGIMRFLLQHCNESVRQKIVEARQPLGRVLIENDVLRRIHTAAYFRVGLEGELRSILGGRSERHTYGRLAVLFCNEEPAVELLEIVSPIEAEAP